jgi:hypothetical protein
LASISISVIVPAYNRADMLPATIESILGQTHAPAEVIVVDDGSTDATPEVLASFGDRLRAIRISNSGELVARNTGLRVATGELVAFCDSDDLWRPTHLAAMARLWAVEPATRAAYANFQIVRQDAWSTHDKFADAPAGFWSGLRQVDPGLGVFDFPLFERLLEFTPFFPSAMAARTDFLREMNGWDEGVNRRMSMDFATALRVVEHPPIGVVLTPTVGIRKHDSNFSGDVQAMNLGDAAILEYVLATRSSAAPHAKVIHASVRQRRLAALETAFARQDFAGIATIRELLGEEALPARIRLKVATARLPAPLRQGVVRMLLALGSLRSRPANARAGFAGSHAGLDGSPR